MAVIPTQQYWPIGSVVVWYGLFAYQLLRDRYRTWTERFFLAACLFLGTYALADIFFFTAPTVGGATTAALVSFSALTLGITFFSLFSIVFYTRMRRALFLALAPPAALIAVLWMGLVSQIRPLEKGTAGPPWLGDWNSGVFTIWLLVMVAYAVVAAYALFRTYREVRAQSSKLRNRMLGLLAAVILALVIGSTNTLRSYLNWDILPLLSTALVLPGIVTFVTLSPAAGERFSSYVRRWKARQYDVKGAFLTFSDGTLIGSRVAPGQAMIDQDLFGATLDVIQNFMRTSFPSLRGSLRSIRHGDYTLVMERGRYTYLTIVLEGLENDQLRRYMRDLLLSFEEENRPILETWRGVPSDALGTEDFITSLMAGG